MCCVQMWWLGGVCVGLLLTGCFTERCDAVVGCTPNSAEFLLSKHPPTITHHHHHTHHGGILERDGRPYGQCTRFDRQAFCLGIL